jgi:DNA adenine methylase
LTTPALFRYSGSKAKLARFLVPLLPSFSHYREPFCGTASFAAAYASQHLHTSIWLNDLDPSIIDLLSRVIEAPGAFSNKILNFNPTIQNYYRAKQILRAGTIDGFSKLIIHQLSYKGEGLQGGPRGGRAQRHVKVDSRWIPQTLLERVKYYNQALKDRTRLSNFDFEEVILKEGSDVLLYLDPPYFGISNLYDLPFPHTDLSRLA